jgi:hypothetical protein
MRVSTVDLSVEDIGKIFFAGSFGRAGGRGGEGDGG